MYNILRIYEKNILQSLKNLLMNATAAYVSASGLLGSKSKMGCGKVKHEDAGKKWSSANHN